MEPKSPERPAPNNITLLKDRITEIPGFQREITVRADNIGASKWPEMLAATKEDGLERGINVFRTPITKKFYTGTIITGTKKDFKTGKNVPIQSSDIGLKGFISDIVASVHTHPLTEEEAHLKTTVPSGSDVQTFFENAYSTMVILDRGGAHLLVRTRDTLNQETPPTDLIQKKINEVAAKGGTVADVQKQLNSMLSQYGISYFYTENLTSAEDGTITFKKP